MGLKPLATESVTNSLITELSLHLNHNFPKPTNPYFTNQTNFSGYVVRHEISAKHVLNENGLPKRSLWL